MGSQRNMPRMVVLGIVVLFMFASQGVAQECLEDVGWLGGDYSALAVSGDYAYLGSGDQFMIVNVANPAAPWEMGSCSIGFEPDSSVCGALPCVPPHRGGSHRQAYHAYTLPS